MSRSQLELKYVSVFLKLHRRRRDGGMGLRCHLWKSLLVAAHRKSFPEIEETVDIRAVPPDFF